MDFQSALGHGLVVAFGFVFVMGLLTALTPCVYPLIPITVSIFGAKQATSKRKAAVLSGAYVFGIAAMYTGLGLAAALTGTVFGRVMANPWVVGTVALVFGTLAASMFGAFELALPTSLQGRLSQVGGKGFAGAILMGLVAGLIAAPCTGPVLAALLTYVATTRDVVLGGSLLFVYALGLGAPFFVIGTFSVALPKSGPWMDAVKSVFGILLLATALYFLKDVIAPLRDALSASTAFRATMAALVAGGVVLGAVHLSFSAGGLATVRKTVGVLCVVVGAFGLAGSFASAEPEAVAGAAKVPWLRNEADGLAKGKATGRPIMIDFGADWCVACKELEHRTYPDPRVVKELERFVPVLLDMTKATDENDALQEKYGVKGLPAVVFISATGQVLPKPRLAGFVPPDEFLTLLKQVQ
jgi:thiol:disulfide interchange protein DsbD